ncbi:MAG: hypothetical protein AAGB03_05510 [Pseudomonadota bacterium]
MTANALRTLNEGTTLNQRTDAYYSLLQDLAGKVAPALETQFRDKLSFLVLDPGL